MYCWRRVQGGAAFPLPVGEAMGICRAGYQSVEWPPF